MMKIPIRPGRTRATAFNHKTNGRVRRSLILKYHPGTPMTVIRRRLTAEFLDLACLAMKFLASGGRSALRPTFTTYHTSIDLAARRLAKAGLIAYRRSRGRPPILKVTRQGRTQGSDILWPERFWNRSWDGHWYVLMYDVPETERRYRCALERFFRHKRMGCLQKSVWISARDIRPLFDELDLAASIRDYAILFEASPVLDQSSRQIAAQAWDFEKLVKQQTSYLNACARRTNRNPDKLKPPAALAAARRELSEFTNAMQDDPLLPMELLPDNYAGRQVVATFRKRTGTLLRQLFTL